jgi:hypothetical protein
MSEQEAAPEQEQGPASEQSPAAEEPPQTFDAEYVKKLRAEAAKYRTENKALSDKAKQWDEHSEAQKTELERALEKKAEAERRMEELRSEAARSKVASKYDLPLSLSDRLRGSSEEEMEEDAKAMLAELEKKYIPKKGPGREETGAGVGGKKPNYEAMSPKELVELVKARRGR